MPRIRLIGHAESDDGHRSTLSSRFLRLPGAVLIVFGLFSCFGLVGCLPVSSSEEDEHQVIEHKPATFAAAVEQVRLRHERLAMDFQKAETAIDAKALSELLDIIGWLTELAADSPMKKPEWDRVNTAAKELLVEYQRIAAATKSQPRGKWPAGASRVDQLVVSLATLVPNANVKP